MTLESVPRVRGIYTIGDTQIGSVDAILQVSSVFVANLSVVELTPLGNSLPYFPREGAALQRLRNQPVNI